MAGPGAVLAAKAALALATDKRTWKAAAIAVAAICMPLILVVVCVLGIASGTAHHNNAAVNLTFNGGAIPASMPAEYRTYITEMRDCFAALDAALAAISRECEWEDGDGNSAELDMIRVKSVFYALYFGDDNLSLRKSEARAFLECFFVYDTNTRPCDDDDCDDDDCEEYDIAIPITDLQTVYASVGSHIGRALTPEDMANINEIYLRVTQGDFSVEGNVSLEGGSNGTHALIAELTAGDDSPAPTGGYVSPIDGDWRSMVSCEYGTGYAGHTGMDLAVPLGTPVYAVADGTVLFTRASSGGYGIHVAIRNAQSGNEWRLVSSTGCTKQRQATKSVTITKRGRCVF